MSHRTSPRILLLAPLFSGLATLAVLTLGAHTAAAQDQDLDDASVNAMVAGCRANPSEQLCLDVRRQCESMGDAALTAPGNYGRLCREILGVTAGGTDDAATGGVTDEQVAAIRERCAANPDDSDCQQLKALCEQGGDDLPAAAKRMCTALAPAASSTTLSDEELAQLSAVCASAPDNEVCAAVKQLCTEAYATLNEEQRRACTIFPEWAATATIAAPAEEPAAAAPSVPTPYTSSDDGASTPDLGNTFDGALVGRYFVARDSERLGGTSNGLALALTLQGAVAKRPVGFGFAFDFAVGSAGALYGEGFAFLGPTFHLSERTYFGIEGGAGYDGIDGRLPGAFSTPVEVSLQSLLFERVRLTGYLRPAWVHGEDRRQDGSALEFADEVTVGADLGFGKTDGDEGSGLAIGIFHRELMGTSLIGVNVGVAGWFFED